MAKNATQKLFRLSSGVLNRREPTVCDREFTHHVPCRIRTELPPKTNTRPVQPPSQKYNPANRKPGRCANRSSQTSSGKSARSRVCFSGGRFICGSNTHRQCD